MIQGLYRAKTFTIVQLPMCLKLMKKSIKTLLICLLACLGLAALAELELRMLGAYGTWEENNQGKYISPYMVRHNTWLLLRLANAQIQLVQPEFSYSFQTNSLGLRDKEHLIEKPAGTKRILVLGDSLVEGQGAPFEAVWPKVLENGLNEQNGGQWEIILAGVAGSDPFYCRQLIKERLMQYEPDMVIMAISSFDVTDVVARGGQERFAPGDKVRYNAPPAWEFWFSTSRLVRFISMRAFGYDWLLQPPEKQEGSKKVAHRQIADLAADMEKMGREKGFSLLFVLQPQLHELKAKTYSYDLERLGRQIQDKGIEVCDIMPCMKNRILSTGYSPEAFFWEKDYHPNSLGYSVYADCVQDFLKQKAFP